jgi:hypothetical protein
VGVLLFCALAAQQQGAKAREAKEERTNYAPVTHNHYKYTYRPAECKTFVQNSLTERRRGSDRKAIQPSRCQ